MAYNIVYKSSIKKDLKKLSKQEAQKILDKTEALLSYNPFAFPMLKGEFKNLRKFRVGNYKVIYAIEENNVLVLKIGDRKKVYK